MTKQSPLNQSLHEGLNYHSPFTKVLGLGFYDGPTNGVLQAGANGPVYKFDLLDDLGNPNGLDLRIFGLAALPSASLARLEDAYAQYWAPHWPIWVPIWQFPTPADQKTAEQLTDEIIQQAGTIEWIIATHDLLGEISAAKAVTPEQVAQISDWPAFLGLPHEPTIKD